MAACVQTWVTGESVKGAQSWSRMQAERIECAEAGPGFALDTKRSEAVWPDWIRH